MQNSTWNFLRNVFTDTYLLLMLENLILEIVLNQTDLSKAEKQMQNQSLVFALC